MVTRLYLTTCCICSSFLNKILSKIDKKYDKNGWVLGDLQVFVCQTILTLLPLLDVAKQHDILRKLLNQGTLSSRLSQL